MLTDRNEVVLIQQCWHREINACSRPLPGPWQLFVRWGAVLREDGPQGCSAPACPWGPGCCLTV